MTISGNQAYPIPKLPAQLSSPHHVDGLRVTGKAEGIAAGRGAEVNGDHHREGGLLGNSSLWLLQTQDLELGSSQQEVLTPSRALFPSPGPDSPAQAPPTLPEQAPG